MMRFTQEIISIFATNMNIMKLQLFSLTTLLALSLNSALAQTTNPSETAANKKVHAGLSLSSGMLFTNFETNTVERSGLGGFFGLGFGFNYAFTKNIGLSSGLEFHFERFSFETTGTTVFQYDYFDREIKQNRDGIDAENFTMTLDNRKQNTVAANIPIMLLFRTNMIGYFRYFGKFGLRNSILLRQRVNDAGISTENLGQQIKLEGMRAANDLFFLRTSAGIAAGTEWNFAATTSLSIEAGFYYGFTPIFNGNGKENRNGSTLYEVKNGERVYRSFKANQSVFEIKAILLF